MEIIVFLFVACCISFIGMIWAIGFFNPSSPKQKHQPKRRLSQQPPKNLASSEQEQNTAPLSQERDRSTSVIDRTAASKQALPISKLQARLPNPKHQRYIRDSHFVLHRLRSESNSVGLPRAISMLRKMNPYAFEELLLSCCEDQGWQIQRNFRYSSDGGIDGRVLIAGKLYLIQAKRYKSHINPRHIQGFHQTIQRESATGGFFIHSRKTGSISKDLIRDFQIILLSGQRLVDFVLGRKLKIVGVTITISDRSANN